MNIEIQVYWGAKVRSRTAPANEWSLKKLPITICDIIINGKSRGSVKWNGSKLSLEVDKTK